MFPNSSLFGTYNTLMNACLLNLQYIMYSGILSSAFDMRLSFIVVVTIFERGRRCNISKWVCKFLEGLFRVWLASNRADIILNMFVFDYTYFPKLNGDRCLLICAEADLKFNISSLSQDSSTLM